MSRLYIKLSMTSLNMLFGELPVYNAKIPAHSLSVVGGNSHLIKNVFNFDAHN